MDCAAYLHCAFVEFVGGAFVYGVVNFLIFTTAGQKRRRCMRQVSNALEAAQSK